MVVSGYATLSMSALLWVEPNENRKLDIWVDANLQTFKKATRDADTSITH